MASPIDISAGSAGSLIAVCYVFNYFEYSVYILRLRDYLHQRNELYYFRKNQGLQVSQIF